MSGDLVLDTSAVIALLRGVSGVEAALDQHERLWLPLIAMGELELGVELASNPTAQRAALDAFLSAVELLPLTAATPRHYARIRGELQRIGTPIPENDIWIAATAIERSWPIASRDAHFTRVSGLQLIDLR